MFEFIIVVVRGNTVRYGFYFHGNQFFMDFVRFLLHAWYNIYSTWFLDIRILTCYIL